MLAAKEVATSVRIGEELRRITELAAVAVGPWIGKGDKNGADQASVSVLQSELEANPLFSCTVVIGEGVKDEAPMLPHGAVLGRNPGLLYDLAVDPLEQTTETAAGGRGGMILAAMGEEGRFLPWIGVKYMQKMAVRPELSDLMSSGDIGLGETPETNLKKSALHLGISLEELRIAVLERERNRPILEAAKKLGVRVILLSGGDVMPALQATQESPEIDMLYSSGGSPEAVLTAAAVSCLGGNMQAKWDPQSDEEVRLVRDFEQYEKVLFLPSLVGTGELHFAATGVTDSELLAGCTKNDDGLWLPGETLLTYRESGGY